MPVHKCLGCRGLNNSGRLPKTHLWMWMVVATKASADYHLVRMKNAIRKVVGGGTVWTAETACGEEFLEEVMDPERD